MFWKAWLVFILLYAVNQPKCYSPLWSLWMRWAMRFFLQGSMLAESAVSHKIASVALLFVYNGSIDIVKCSRRGGSFLDESSRLTNNVLQIIASHDRRVAFCNLLINSPLLITVRWMTFPGQERLRAFLLLKRYFKPSPATFWGQSVARECQCYELWWHIHRGKG